MAPAYQDLIVELGHRQRGNAMRTVTGRWIVAVALFVYCATAGADRAVTPISVCKIPDRAPYAAMQPQQVHFTNVAAEAGLMERQCFIRTTPNCLFRQYDPKLKRWDKGGFCLEETMTGGACIGDADGDGLDDIFFPRMDGHDILYRNRGDGTFSDRSELSGLSQFPHTHSNGCNFVDIDNDGDNDVYVSTVGDTQFYLYVNDGTGTFTEEAIERGLGNVKQDGRLTGGFSIGVSDIDLDGDLDIVTTEWLPWLEHSETRQGHHKDEVSMDGVVNKKRLVGANMTNSRLYLNQGPGALLGHFVDYSEESRTEVNVEVNADVTSHLKSVCQLLPAEEARATLELLGEHIQHSDDPLMAEEHIHQAFYRMVRMYIEGKTLRGRMKYTMNKADPKHYKYVTVKASMLPRGATTLSISLSSEAEYGPVELYVGGDKIDRPVAARHKYTYKSTSTKGGVPAHLNLTIGGAWGFRNHHIGVRCLNKNGCRFELSYLGSVGTPGDLIAHEDCGEKWKMRHFAKKMRGMGLGLMDKAQGGLERMINERDEPEKLQKEYGPFQINLMFPWIKSEKFAQHTVAQMQGLGYSIHTTRKVFRDLLKAGNKLDKGKYDKMVRSTEKIKEVLSKDYPVDDGNWEQWVGMALKDTKLFSKYLLGEDNIEQIKDAAKKHVQENTGERSLEQDFLDKGMEHFGIDADGTQKKESLASSKRPHVLDSSTDGVEGERLPQAQSPKKEEEEANPSALATSRDNLIEDAGEPEVENEHQMFHAYDLPLTGPFQFAVKFADFDHDFYPDMVISGDFGTSRMFWNERNGSFREGHFNFIEDFLDNSMGATIGDWNLDGRLDLMFTSVSIPEKDLKTLQAIATTSGFINNFRGNHMYQNMGGRRFEDMTDHAGVRESGWGWGAFMFDFDNDGDLDVLNGNGMDDPETTDDDWACEQKARLYVNSGPEGKFRMEDEALIRGLADTGDNRGTMSFDYDQDGDLDVLVINHGEIPALYRNDGGNYYDYVRVQVLEESGRESIGAKVFVRTTKNSKVPDMIQEIGSSAAFLGQTEATAHFGLGKDDDTSTIYSVRVQWPPILKSDLAGTSSAPALPVNDEDIETVTIYNVQRRSTLVVRRGYGGGKVVSINGEDIPSCPATDQNQ